MNERSDPVYSVDSSALIHGWRRIYRPRNFGFVWARIDTLINTGRLRASIEVYRELEKKDDEVFAWCKERKDQLFIEIDDQCQRQVSRLMVKYPRLVDTVTGRSGGDPFVIALAASRSPPMVVVSEENPGRQRIPDVCRDERIRCVRLPDLIEAEDWRFE